MSISCKDGQLKQFDLLKKAKQTKGKMDTCRNFLLFSGTNDVRHMVGQGPKNGCSPVTIQSKIQQVFRGKYKARGYGDDDCDLASMVMRTGGAALCMPCIRQQDCQVFQTCRGNVHQDGMKFIPSVSLGRESLEKDNLVNMKQIAVALAGIIRLWRLLVYEVAMEMRAR